MHTRLIFCDRSVIILEGTESIVATSDVIESPMLRQRTHATQGFQEKLRELLCGLPVPQTDTGIRDEYSKARGLNLLKELGKLAPYLR